MPAANRWERFKKSRQQKFILQTDRGNIQAVIQDRKAGMVRLVKHTPSLFLLAQAGIDSLERQCSKTPVIFLYPTHTHAHRAVTCKCYLNSTMK